MIRGFVIALGLLAAAPAAAQEFATSATVHVVTKNAATVTLVCDVYVWNPNGSRTCVQPDRRVVTWLPDEPLPLMSRVFDQLVTPPFIESGSCQLQPAPMPLVPGPGPVLWEDRMPPVPLPIVAEAPCRQRLGWFDKWVVLPLSGGAGFRDAISTVSALNRVESAREANPIYRALGADPETHAEAFAWLKGGVTTTVLVTAGTLMTSCRPAERWIGRWLAIGHGGVALWAARHNDRVGRPR